jgi:hypothetical protein
VRTLGPSVAIGVAVAVDVVDRRSAGRSERFDELSSSGPN